MTKHKHSLKLIALALVLVASLPLNLAMQSQVNHQVPRPNAYPSSTSAEATSPGFIQGNSYNFVSATSSSSVDSVKPTSTAGGNLIPEGSGYMGIGYEEEAGFEATANFDVQPVGQYVHGLDVSKWQGDINWQQVSNDVYRFVFAKATEGWGFTDAKYHTNMQQARASNVFIGPYHFARPDLNANAVNEATWFAQSVAPYLQTNYLRPVLDLEVLPAGWSWEQLSAWTETFMVSFTALTGVEPILYISGNYSNNLSSYLTKYDIWIAHWRYNLNLVPNTGHWDEWLAWQWSNQGSSQGIAGRVDLNVTNENFYKMLISDPALPLGQGFMGSSYEDAEQPAASSTGGFSVQAEEYLHGIDVSNHQNVIQWPLVADDGYTFAIAKATEGWGWDDDYFTANMQQADAAGVVIGAYHFARPDLNNTAVIEATWFASVVGPYLGEGNIRPVLDLERRGSLSWSQLSTWANDFMVTFENLTGVEPMIYINSNYANNLDASLNHYDLWIAHWHDINIPPNTGRWSNWVLWQWGGTAVAGVEDPIVDRNVSRSNLHDAVIGETVFWTTN